jgi:hypothetical protein
MGTSGLFRPQPLAAENRSANPDHRSQSAEPLVQRPRFSPRSAMLPLATPVVTRYTVGGSGVFRLFSGTFAELARSRSQAECREFDPPRPLF